MRDARTVVDFLDGDYAFDEEAFRAETIGNFPYGGDGGPSVDAEGADGVAADDD
jgi:malate dehydrogenase (quinone)